MRFVRRAATRTLATMALVIATLGLVQAPASAAPASPVTLQILISGSDTSANHVIIAVNRPGKSSDYPCEPLPHGVRTDLVLDLPVGSYITVFPANGCYGPAGNSSAGFAITERNQVLKVDLVA